MFVGGARRPQGLLLAMTKVSAGDGKDAAELKKSELSVSKTETELGFSAFSLDVPAETAASRWWRGQQIITELLKTRSRVNLEDASRVIQHRWRETGKAKPMQNFNARIADISKWDGPRFNGSALKKALQDTVLIDAEWLADLADVGGVVPRCQDLPNEAKVTLPQLEAWKFFDDIGVVILSYPWLAATHPDPHGDQLRSLGRIFRVFADMARTMPRHKGTRCRVGVFWE